MAFHLESEQASALHCLESGPLCVFSKSCWRNHQTYSTQKHRLNIHKPYLATAQMDVHATTTERKRFEWIETCYLMVTWFHSAEISLENWICSCFFHKIPDSLQCKKKMIQLTWSEENFFLALKVQHHTWTWGCLDYSFPMNSATPADGCEIRWQWFTVYSYLISKPIFS